MSTQPPNLYPYSGFDNIKKTANRVFVFLLRHTWSFLKYRHGFNGPYVNINIDYLEFPIQPSMRNNKTSSVCIQLILPHNKSHITNIRLPKGFTIFSYIHNNNTHRHQDTFYMILNIRKHVKKFEFLRIQKHKFAYTLYYTYMKDTELNFWEIFRKYIYNILSQTSRSNNKKRKEWMSH